MGFARANGVRLRYELAGSGPIAVALVHGSWGSHREWDAMTAGLSKSLRVAAYDRRGHSESARPSSQGSVGEDVADLAALLEALHLAPAFLVGNSFGASIGLRLAAERPDLVRGVVAHEPPLVALLAGDPQLSPILEETRRRVGAVAQRIAAGEHAAAAEQFAETVALGPGSWERLPPQQRDTMIENAPKFLDETRDPAALAIDLDALRGLDRPVLLTRGEHSPPMFGAVVAILATALPRTETVALTGTGHVPHVTDPDRYVDVVTGFVRAHGGK